MTWDQAHRLELRLILHTFWPSKVRPSQQKQKWNCKLIISSQNHLLQNMFQRRPVSIKLLKLKIMISLTTMRRFNQFLMFSWAKVLTKLFLKLRKSMKLNKFDNSNINITKEREMMTKNGKVRLRKKSNESRLRTRILISLEARESNKWRPWTSFSASTLLKTSWAQISNKACNS